MAEDGSIESSGFEEQKVTISFTVLPPTAEIKTPPTGETYKEGEVVPTTFSCAEGAGGPGIETCLDEFGKSESEGGKLETMGLGLHHYTVTATSLDGQTGPAKIEYTIIPAPPACSAVEGTGFYLKSGQVGRVTVRDKLSTAHGATQQLQVSNESGKVRFGLTKLTKASCDAITGGFAFNGEGPAREYKKSGYTVHVSISIKSGHAYFSAKLTKGATVINEATGEPLSKSNEVIH